MRVEFGIRINLIRRNTLTQFADNAKEHSLPVTIADRDRPINVYSVGKGAAACTQLVTIPVAVKYQDEPPQVHPFHANVADGSCASLPAILGKGSMESRDAVILLRRGTTCMAFPGPGGYRVEWPGDTSILPMEHSPPGHFVIPCDTFQDAETQQGVHSFYTDH